MGEMPLEVLVCVCGYPVMPNLGGTRGRSASAEVYTFLDSMKKAHAFLNAPAAPAGPSPEAVNGIVQAAVADFVSLSEFPALISRLAALEAAVTAPPLPSPAPAAPADKPEKPKVK